MTIPSHRAFAYCPRCRAPYAGDEEAPCLVCAECGFTYYFNPAVATGAIIEDEAGRVLLLRRAREPSRGMLGLPGGFADRGETAEEAIRREVREEIGMELGGLHYLTSFPNQYAYRDLLYSVLDLFFTARVPSFDGAEALDDVDALVILTPAELDLDQVAFPSQRRALARYLEARTPGHPPR